MERTRVTRRIRASRSAVYRALLGPEAVQLWMVPDGMTSHVHEFQAHDGGRFRTSLTYDGSTGAAAGKTSAQTDTYQGRFVRLVPDVQVVQVIEFETDDPTWAGRDDDHVHARRYECWH